ncbi:MAG TPA: alpha/beta fold hydrolase [Bryobacteraceae bacterium]|nr:alpha/beta fold hydrolase [Bryobacteraceae bacterium]
MARLQTRTLVLGLLLTAPAHVFAQGRPPVVFVNGYQIFPICNPSDDIGDFGQLPALLGQQYFFFDNPCYGRVSIDQLGAAFGQFLDGLGVPEVDVIAHSMGGLIVRSYLTGLQGGVFSPPVDVKIRKVIFLATPHFGTSEFAFGAGTQIDDMRPGSTLLFNLATWNQGTDDLRGVDAIAVIGNAGTAFDDGVVPLTAASLSFTESDPRTRVVPCCHTSSPFVSCQAGSLPIAEVNDTTHPTYQIAAAFLADNPSWQSVGHSPLQDSYLATTGGAYVSLRTSSDQLQELASVSATGQTTSATYSLSSRIPQVFVQQQMIAQPYQFTMQVTDGTSTQAQATVAPGGTHVVSFKSGPVLFKIQPAAAQLPFLSTAPRMIVSIYGRDLAMSKEAALNQPLPPELAGTTVLLGGQPIGLLYASPEQINAVLPSGISGLQQLTVQNSDGQHSLNVLLEPSVPTLFSSDQTGSGLAAAINASTGEIIGPESPVHAGQFVSLYGTGLGETQRIGNFDYATTQPTATIGGIAAKVLFAGAAPGYAGLDQINVEVPADVAPGDAVPVSIQANGRVSNTVTLPVQ